MELFFRTGSGKSSGSGHRFTWKAVGESRQNKERRCPEFGTKRKAVMAAEGIKICGEEVRSWERPRREGYLAYSTCTLPLFFEHTMNWTSHPRIKDVFYSQSAAWGMRHAR